MIREHFVRVLREYRNLAGAIPAGHALARNIRHDFPEAIERIAGLGSGYKVEGSPGAGLWAEVPWVSIFDLSITDSAQRGYYIVYLFNANMEGVYLSLNQGWTQYKEKYVPVGVARERIKANAAKFQALVAPLPAGFTLAPIALGTEKTLGKGYELGHVCGKYYPADSIPSDSELVADLRNLIEVYKELKDAVGKNTFDVAQIPLASPEAIEENEDQFENNVAPLGPPLRPGPLSPPTKRSAKGREYNPRDRSQARRALDKAGYRCEINADHKTFKLANGNSYMEAHHLVPMEFQEDISKRLDVEENIISLCPTCHRLIRYAVDTARRRYITMLYQSRKRSLGERGIDVGLRRLLSFYDVRRVKAKAIKRQNARISSALRRTGG